MDWLVHQNSAKWSQQGFPLQWPRCLSLQALHMGAEPSFVIERPLLLGLLAKIKCSNKRALGDQIINQKAVFCEQSIDKKAFHLWGTLHLCSYKAWWKILSLHQKILLRWQGCLSSDPRSRVLDRNRRYWFLLSPWIHIKAYQAFQNLRGGFLSQLIVFVRSGVWEEFQLPWIFFRID